MRCIFSFKFQLNISCYPAVTLVGETFRSLVLFVYSHVPISIFLLTALHNTTFLSNAEALKARERNEGSTPYHDFSKLGCWEKTALELTLVYLTSHV